MKVRKLIGRPLAILMAVCLLSQTVGAVESTRESDRIQKDIVVSDGIDKEKAELIISAINGDEITTTRNILCIFGHSTARGSAQETIHRQYASAPRCLRNTYDVVYCTRSGCNYMTFTLISQLRINCCS